MEYAKLARIYGELEKTAKRLGKTYIISEFLKEIKTEDISIIVLLLQGRLFPHWDTREIGVASRIIIKAISKATGISASQIENEWRRKGDLGIVTGEFIEKKKQRTLFSHELTVKKIIEVDDKEEYKRHLDYVQNAYDVTNDFSTVAESARKGLKGLGGTSLIIG